MYSTKDQIEILQSIKLAEGESKTIDCPFCYGKKKFSISNKEGAVLWNCYKATCKARGAYQKGYGLKGIRNRVNNLKQTSRKYIRPIPETLSRPSNHPAVMKYLDENGCNPAHEQSLIKIRYAPADNRCLFLMNDGLGAVGRSLENATPKWMSYGDTTGVLTVGTSDHAIIVEDAPSACAVGSIKMYTGVAILGTSLSTKQKQSLKHYKKVTICLDNDAKKKAITLLRQLQGSVDCTVRFISNDLKYCSSESIVNLVDGNSNVER
jgi:hypothetical protein|tara:strand:- start:86 stop:880 length:795 start_codon:yes stop_codon:yes gene_type:complete